MLLFSAACSTKDENVGKVEDTSPDSDDGEVIASCPSSCDDQIACTVDLCVAGACVNAAADDACGEGEVCRPGFGCFVPEVPDRCTSATDPICDDGQACTTDTCDTATGKCVYTPSDAACDDGNFCDGAERCAPFVGCVDSLPPDCNDEVACTLDFCDGAANKCVNQPEDKLCTDNIQCDGLEQCIPGEGCRENPNPPGCDDGFDCTTDKCDLEAGGCVFTANDSACAVGEICRLDQGCSSVPTCSTLNDPACNDGQACTVDTCDLDTGKCRFVPNNTACDNGAFCDGEEICAPFIGCVAGVAPACEDGVACTLDSCDESTNRCVNKPDNRLCSDGAFCDGDEICNPAVGCQEGLPRVCDDQVACTDDRCEPSLPGGGGCLFLPVDARCSDGVFCDGEERCDAVTGCSEGSRPDCDDGVPCTRDLCQGSKCVHLPDDSFCNDGEICRGDVGCYANRCQTENDPICDDGQACTSERCNLETGKCEYTPNDTACNDGLFCNGQEVCAPFRGCLIASITGCDDGIECTIDRCNEESDSCSHLPEPRLCSNEVFCDGAEICDAEKGCLVGVAPTCADDTECTVDSCNTVLDRCTNTPRDADNDGSADKSCGGLDCNDGDNTVNPAQTEICNGVDDNCDGDTDEGVSSACGNCDASCNTEAVGDTTGSNVINFIEDDMVGTYFDEGADGLMIQQVTLTSNYLWIPNTADSSLSKWDASTATELARYKVGIQAYECLGSCCTTNGCNMPSRVVVDGRGDAYIANRGFGVQGTLTKIAGDISRCVDRNNNGKIDTSTSATAMAWNTDECVLYNANVGPVDSWLRALAIDRGDAAHPEGYPWVGGYRIAKFWKRNPDDGSAILEVDIPVQAYGGVVTADGKLWIGVLDADGFAYIDTTTNAVSAKIPFPDHLRGSTNAYGITADAKGRIWLAGWGGNDALGYDPSIGKWTRINTTSWGMTTGRGITVDRLGRVWMAVGGDGQSYVTVWDSDIFKADTNITHTAPLIRLPDGHSGPSGVGADAEGNIWVAHHATSQLVRIKPETLQLTSYTGPNRVYTYSDFTGSVRRSVIGQGAYVHDVNAGCANPVWDKLVWESTVPTNASVEFQVRTAASTLDLASATTVKATSSPANLATLFSNAAITPKAVLGITVQLKAGDGNASPVVKSFRVDWRCP